MDRVLLDRRNFLVALTGGAALLLFAASRNTNKIAAPSFHVPEVSVAEAKKLLDAGTIWPSSQRKLGSILISSP